MTFIDTLMKKTIVRRKIEELLYSMVARELETGLRHQGLWLKAGLRARTDAQREPEYIRLRMQSLRDDLEILSARSKNGHSGAQSPDIDILVRMIRQGPPFSEILGYLSALGETDMETVRHRSAPRAESESDPPPERRMDIWA